MREDLLRQFMMDRTAYLGYLFVLTRDSHLAEDLMQEAFIIVMRKLDQFDTSRDFGSWVRGICRNLALAELRKQQKCASSPQPELEAAFEKAFEGDEPTERAERVEQLKKLHQCLERLAAPLREMLELRYGENLSLEVLGRRAGKSAKAMQMMLSRSRQVLARCVKGGGMAIHGT